MSEVDKGIELNHSPVLFLDERNNPLTFIIKPCADKEAIREMIEFGGGEVVSIPGDYGITLIPEDVALIGNDEVFSIQYIKECCTRNKLLNLNSYRLNTESRYSDGFEVMDVLLKYTSWSDALKGIPYERSFYLLLSSSPSDSSFEDDLGNLELAPGPSSSHAVGPHLQTSCSNNRMDNNKSEKKSLEGSENPCGKWLEKR
ncbi:Telomeric repeat-binding factor 2-interacting protein 1 [Zootermopsis nevadensis]|nr:Telomeric repeat-binding factor 2-interacting protein 1 [Zootermopsis nevadensis]